MTLVEILIIIIITLHFCQHGKTLPDSINVFSGTKGCKVVLKDTTDLEVKMEEVFIY